MKLKSLAAESRIIKAEQRRYPGTSDTFRSLYLHRIHVVRLEYRATHLLRMFARGVPYSRVESNPDKNCWFRGRAIRKAEKMGERFGIDTTHLMEWFKT